jgi:RNA polymerase sigma factor (TIGR02999 family)
MEKDVTQLFLDAQDGDVEAGDRVFDLVYHELRRVARQQLRRMPDGTIATTALVHEAYIKLFDRSRLNVRDRTHFLALAARAMRQVLVDHFRRGAATKRGGGHTPLSLNGREIPVEQRGEVLLALHEALAKLARIDKRLGQVVEYRFFGGMTETEIGEVLSITDRTVRSDWAKARAWLSQELSTE